jgi:hypothetical protein
MIAAATPTAYSKTLSSIEAVQIGACISVAARGALWLERTLWGLFDQEGGWIGAEVANTNGTHDLGPLQVNSWWVPRIAKALARSEEMVRYRLRFDPCFNVETARWIFVSGLRSRSGFWEAVGAYHSPTVWRQREYARSVAAHLRRRYGAKIFPQLDWTGTRP